MAVPRKAVLGLAVVSAATCAVVGNSASEARAAGVYYGALALSSSTGAVASAVNFASAAAAETAARAECGVTDCRAVVQFWNACGSVARGADGKHGWAWAPTRAEAEQKAIGTLGLSAPAFPDLGSAIPRAATIRLTACTATA
ncbi:DUF4189 domain-containing protein [Streptomyces gardneri]|uniref:DUF4189 domain-containing protein n=1 Tax=Nocardia TaxID=1817 RepID=UPI00135BB363|nr:MULTISPECIES: DUF4189 domain-containing protein [Nocardia]MBF6167582.1 DUF4189 domain-containing protein [Streptomyces gardneri]MBF6206357.1 DUF4189 domain-containing protein [Streptomyces gardneri]UAK30344.1 DUF4189 domain-containing protein [Nocardia asteroides]